MAGVFNVSITDIIRAGGSVELDVFGDIHRIRSDFPVEIYFDGETYNFRSKDTQTFRPNPPMPPYHTIRKTVKRITLKLPALWGGYGASAAANKAMIEGLYGLCVVESLSGPDAAFEPFDPRLLMPHVFQFVEDTDYSQPPGVYQSDHPVVEWLVGGFLPAEIFITNVALFGRAAAQLPVNNPNYEWYPLSSNVTCLRQANGAAGERNDLWNATVTDGGTLSVPFIKMPLASLLAPWGVETPTIAFEYHKNRPSHVHMHLMTIITANIRW